MYIMLRTLYMWTFRSERLLPLLTLFARELTQGATLEAAGKMHGDLSKSAKDTTLEHSLFAAFNTD
jgi:hypothetical protein